MRHLKAFVFAAVAVAVTLPETARVTTVPASAATVTPTPAPAVCWVVTSANSYGYKPGTQFSTKPTELPNGTYVGESTPCPNASPGPTATSTPTASPNATASATPIASVTPSATPPGQTPTPTPLATGTPSPTAVPTATPPSNITTTIAPAASPTAALTGVGSLSGVIVTSVGFSSSALPITDGVGGATIFVVPPYEPLGDVPFYGGSRPFVNSLYVNSGVGSPGLTLIYSVGASTSIAYTVPAAASPFSAKSTAGMLRAMVIDSVGTAPLVITDGVGGNVIAYVPAFQPPGDVQLPKARAFQNLYVNSSAGTPAATLIAQ